MASFIGSAFKSTDSQLLTKCNRNITINETCPSVRRSGNIFFSFYSTRHMSKMSLETCGFRFTLTNYEQRRYLCY